MAYKSHPSSKHIIGHHFHKEVEMKYTVLFLFATLFLASCAAPATPAPTQTFTSEPPTFTPTSTFTPVPPTFAPTLTPTPGLGSTYTSPKDGMVIVYVPAGNFPMGSNDGRPDQAPVHTVSLDAFWIDQTDATNAMYAKCVDASACKQPADLGSATHDSYFGNSQFDNYPVINVDWNMADTYCKWAGRQLPTEAQWEKAARGPNGNAYPWGNSFNGTLTNYCDKSCSLLWADHSFNDGYADVSPVG